MPNLRAGDLATPITIKTPVVTQDADGGKVETYSTLTTVWASVQFNPGGRVDTTSVSGGSRLRRSVRLKIRYFAALTENCLITLNGKDYEINAMDNLYNLNEYLVLDLTSVN